MTADPAEPAATVCFACGEPVGATDSFCESCGAELAPLSVSDGHDAGPPGVRVLLLIAHQRGRLLRVLRPQGAVGP